MVLEYQQTRQDVIAASGLMTSRMKWFFLIMWSLVFVTNLPALKSAATAKNAGPVIAQFLPLILLGALLILLAWIQPRYVARRTILRAVKWSLSDDGVQIESEVASSKIRWPAFLKTRESNKVFLLYVQKGQAQFIPKRVLSQSQIEELRGLFNTHIQSDSNA